MTTAPLALPTREDYVSAVQKMAAVFAPHAAHSDDPLVRGLARSNLAGTMSGEPYWRRPHRTAPAEVTAMQMKWSAAEATAATQEVAALNATFTEVMNTGSSPKLDNTTLLLFACLPSSFQDAFKQRYDAAFREIGDSELFWLGTPTREYPFERIAPASAVMCAYIRKDEDRAKVSLTAVEAGTNRVGVGATVDVVRVAEAILGIPSDRTPAPAATGQPAP